jgi:hypothetical protein
MQTLTAPTATADDRRRRQSMVRERQRRRSSYFVRPEDVEAIPSAIHVVSAEDRCRNYEQWMKIAADNVRDDSFVHAVDSISIPLLHLSHARRPFISWMCVVLENHLKQQLDRAADRLLSRVESGARW